MADEVEANEDQDTPDDEDLSPEELAEKKAEEQYQQFVQIADEVLNRWTEAQPVEVREAAIDAYVETGEMDPATAGVDEIEIGVLQAAYHQHVERKVLKPLGLTLAQWHEHIDDAELPLFRAAVVKGNWPMLIAHAQLAAAMRKERGI